MESQAGGQVNAHSDPTEAVAMRIEWGRVRGNTELTVDDSHDSSAHTALGGYANLVRPMTGVVVHTAREHNR